MALDLGIINIAAGYISNGSSFIIPGGELLALDRYFHKEKARCTNSKSRKCRLLNRKWGRQRKHYLHVLTKHLVNAAQANGVSVIVVGKLKGIRRDKDWGAKANQRLHAWPFKKIVSL
jgi:putative transposase